jgi:membrane-bound lytic murein transglycosylase
VPYYERGEIEDGKLLGKGLEIAWAADPVEFFFLQIQGSGRLRAPTARSCALAMPPTMARTIPASAR